MIWWFLLCNPSPITTATFFFMWMPFSPHPALTPWVKLSPLPPPYPHTFLTLLGLCSLRIPPHSRLKTCHVGPLPCGHSHCFTWAQTPPLSCIRCSSSQSGWDTSLSPFFFFYLILFHLMILGLNCSGRGKGTILYYSQNKNSHHCFYPSSQKVERVNDYL